MTSWTVAAFADRDRPELVLVDGAREDRQEPVGSGVRGEVPVLGRRPSSASRTEPPTTYAAWPCAHSRAMSARTEAGASIVRCGIRARHRAEPTRRVRLVAAEEQVRPPGLVALVGEVRREQRVQVAARLERRRAAAAPAPPRASSRPCGGCTTCTPRRGCPRCGSRRGGAGRCGRASGRGACRPQYWQVCRSRAKTSRRVSLTRGRGRLTWCCSRITDGRVELLGDRADDLVVVLEDLGLRARTRAGTPAEGS